MADKTTATEYLSAHAATPAGYTATADELTQRILALIPDHPYVLTMDDPWALLKVPGFDCSDLGPTLFQAGWSLRTAQNLYRQEHPSDG